jgi:hypothetical protein
MVWVEPKHLTFASGESVAFFLHERHEVPGDVGVTLALELFSRSNSLSTFFAKS